MIKISNLLPVAAAVAVVSCASQLDDPMRSVETTRRAPKPDAAMAKRSGEKLETIGHGYWVFQRKCLECHEARVPKDPTLAVWHPTMVGMSWNAGLSQEEEAALMAYMRAAVK